MAATTMLFSLQTTLFLVLPLSSLLLLLLLLLGGRRRNQSTSHGSGLLLPPSPPRLPLIGNLHQLGPLLHRSLAARARTLGPLMLLHVGHVRTLVVSSPDVACDVLRNQDQACAGRPATSAAKILLYGCKDLAFATYGQQWRQLRKICAVHLLGSKRVQSYRPAREEKVAAMIASVAAASATSAAGGAVDMSTVLVTFTNNVVCRVVSGKIKEEEGRNEMFSSLIEETVTLLAKFYLGDYFPWLGWADRFVAGYLKRAEKSRRRWDDLLEEVIKEHEDRGAVMAEKKKDDRDAELEERDFVDVLVSLKEEAGLTESLLTPSDIKGLLLDMFAAGTDTSYVTLEWALAELIRSPRAMRRLQEEVRGKTGRKEMVREEEVKEMRYLKAVVKEVLRLHPPIPLLLPREVLEDGVVIQGYDIPRKTRILVNVWAIHRDPNYWDEPEEFRPERFTEDDGGAQDFNGTDFRFLPFGAGRRICPGLQFAVASLELALANLVHHFDWELPAGMRAEEFHTREADGTVVHREGRLHIVAKPWIASAAV